MFLSVILLPQLKGVIVRKIDERVVDAGDARCIAQGLMNLLVDVFPKHLPERFIGPSKNIILRNRERRTRCLRERHELRVLKRMTLEPSALCQPSSVR